MDFQEVAQVEEEAREAVCGASAIQNIKKFSRQASTESKGDTSKFTRMPRKAAWGRNLSM